MAYVIKQRRRTCCTCSSPVAQTTPGAALRAAGFFQAFPTARQMETLSTVIQPRVPEPFYNGPCGTEVTVPSCCQTNDFYPTYAYFTQLNSLTLAAGGAIPFDGPFHVSPTGIQCDNGEILLAQPGTYRIGYMIHIPPNTAVDTTFSLVVGGITVPGTVLSVAKSATADSEVVSAEAIITTDVSSLIQVISANALSLSGLNTVATLTLHRIA